MPFGTFLDQLPAALFIAAHLAFLAVGAWAVYATSPRRAVSRAFGLYAISQLAFLAFFGGALTLKMAVLLEQTLLVVLVASIAISLRSPGEHASASRAAAR